MPKIIINIKQIINIFSDLLGSSLYSAISNISFAKNKNIIQICYYIFVSNVFIIKKI